MQSVPSLELRLLENYSTTSQLRAVLEKSKKLSLHSILVFSSAVGMARDCIEDSLIHVSCIVGYPHGSPERDAKRYEIEVAIDHGAHEIEYHPFMPLLHENNLPSFQKEINDAIEAADERPLYLAADLNHLTQEECNRMAEIAETANVKGLSFPTLEAADAASMTKLRIMRSCNPELTFKLPIQSNHNLQHYTKEGFYNFSVTLKLLQSVLSS